MVRSDVWVHDTCLVCQSKHATDEEKEGHETEGAHCKKTVVYDFLSKELSCLVASSSKSVLFERYYRANATVAGLDCICELNFPAWSTSPLWACTICYVAGRTLDSADSHLYSSYHRRNYISEYHPDRFAELVRAQEKSASEKHSMIEQETILNLLYEARGLAPPSVYLVNDRDRAWAYEKLGLGESESSPHSTIEPISDLHQIVLCHVCGESYIAFEKEELASAAWNAHLSTRQHQQCQFIATLVQEAKPTLSDGLPKGCRVRSESAFTERSEGVFYGPSCGYEYLVTFKGSSESFCQLCFCIVLNGELTDHFSCEYHVERLVRRGSPSKLLHAEYSKTDDRQELLIGSLDDTTAVAPAQQKHQVCAGSSLPLLLKSYAYAEKRAFEVAAVEEVWVGSSKAMWCKECKQYVMLVDADSWQLHIFDECHFDCAAKKALYCNFDDGIISKLSTLAPFRRGSATPRWEERFSVALGGVTQAQDHCEFAMNFIVRDELSKQSVCTCCYVALGYDNDEALSLHARSYDHLLRAIHSLSKKMVAVAWKVETVETTKKLLLEYIQHVKLTPRSSMMAVYDPVLAFFVNCLGVVSPRLLELARIPPEQRSAKLSALAEGATPKENLSFNTALRATNVEVVSIGNNVITFYCQDCGQGYSCVTDRTEASFADHILSRSHWKRKKLLKENQLDPNKRLFNTSSIAVDPFQQPNPKKVTWKWNDILKTFEFVYATLGLSDVVERRNFSGGKRDLFCTLCLESMKAGKADLQHHVRSFGHVFFYVHKHQPQIIADVEALLMEPAETTVKRKNARRLFARSLKGLEKEKGEIPIYSYTHQYCESAEVKSAVEEDVGSMQQQQPPIPHNTAPGSTPVPNSNKHLWRAPSDVDLFIQMALDKSLISEASGTEMTLEVAKHKFLTETDMDGVVESTKEGNKSTSADTSQEEKGKRDGANRTSRRGTSDQKTDAKRSGRSPSQRSRRSPSPRKRRSSRSSSRTPAKKQRSPSPSYKAFHAAPQGGFDLRNRPAFKSYHVVAGLDSKPFTERLGGAQTSSTRVFPHLMRASVSPDRTGTTTTISISPQRRDRSRSRSRRVGRSRSGSRPRLVSSRRSRSRGRSPRRRSRSPARGARRRSRSRSTQRQRRSRSPYDRRRRSRSRSSSRRDVKPSVDHHRVEPRDVSRRVERRLVHDGEERSTDRATNRTPLSQHSRSSSDERPLVHRLALRSEQQAKQIHINLNPARAVEPPSVQAYRIRNAPDPASININRREVDNDSPPENLPNAASSSSRSSSRTVAELLASASAAANAEAVVSNTTGPVPLYSIQIPMQFAAPPPSVKIMPGIKPSLLFPTSSSNASQLADVSTTPQQYTAAAEPFIQHPYQQAVGAANMIPPVQQPVILDHAEVVMRAKMELYSKDLQGVHNITELIGYLWKQGYDRIPDTDPPLLFNEVVKRKKGVVGASTLYQIVCYGHPELETYYCGMCNHWTTVSEMFLHLGSAMHRLSYLHRNYKMYHRRAMEEPDENARDFLLTKFTEKIHKAEGSGHVVNRMRCILNEEAIRRLWPEYEEFIDNSWKIMDEADEIELAVTKRPQEAPQQQFTGQATSQASGSNGAQQPDNNGTNRGNDAGEQQQRQQQQQQQPADSSASASAATNRPSQVSTLEAAESRAKQQKSSGVADDPVLMRRAIGAMAELQSMFEAQGRMDASTIFRVCEDMGIEAKDAVQHPLILQASTAVFNVDLEEAYLLGPPPSARAAPPAPARHVVRQLGSVGGNDGNGAGRPKESQNIAATRLDLQSMGLGPHEIEAILSKVGKNQTPSTTTTATAPALRNKPIPQTLSNYGYPSHGGGMEDMDVDEAANMHNYGFFGGGGGIPAASSYFMPQYSQQPSVSGYSGYFAAGEFVAPPATSVTHSPKPPPPPPKVAPPKSSKPNANLEPIGPARRLPPSTAATTTGTTTIGSAPVVYYTKPSSTQPQSSQESYGQPASPPVMARANYHKQSNVDPHKYGRGSAIPPEVPNRQQPPKSSASTNWLTGALTAAGASTRHDFTSDEIGETSGSQQPTSGSSLDPDCLISMASQIGDWGSLSTTMSALLGKKK